jgi:hypothetical protein
MGLFIPQMIHEYGEPQWNDIDGKTDELGEKPFLLPLCPPQAPRFLTQAPIPDLLERPVTNR